MLHGRMRTSHSASGTVRPAFRAVRDAFSAHLDQDDTGASLCVYVDGECVVDLWGGLADRASAREWQADTLGVVFSATKGMVATCLLMLHDRGELDYDAPVATYWPAFARAGKETITVRQVLNHTSGVVGVHTPLSLRAIENLDTVARALERQTPFWEPGTQQGYHGVTFGLMTAVLFQRITGTTVGRFLRDEVARPLGADVFLGLPSSEDGRTAVVYPQGRRGAMRNIVPRMLLSRGTEGRVFRAAVDRDSMTAAAFRHPKDLGVTGVTNFNRTRVRRQELAWAGAMASARGLARVYQVLATGELDGVRLVRDEVRALPTHRDSFSQSDAVLHRPMGFSHGFVKEDPGVFGPELAAFGHPGAGGALGWCDPVNGVSIGYVPNCMDFRIRSRRTKRLVDAVYDCL